MRGNFNMAVLSNEKLMELTMEILMMERKNLRSRAKTDHNMSQEIQKVIKEYAALKC